MVNENGGKILIVEDSNVQARLLSSILSHEGYTVLRKTEGAEALRSLETSIPDLIISDVWMPGMNGYEFCTTVKAIKEYQHIPIILLTSMSKFDNVVRGLEVGADYYLTKPYSKELLLSMVKSIFSDSVQTCAAPDQFCERGNASEYPTERVFNFLFSTYQNLFFQNADLMETRQELKRVNTSLEKKIEEKTASLRGILDGIVIVLSRMVETRDPYTAGHQLRVSQLAKAIAIELGLESPRLQGIEVMGLVHDVGKIIVPAEILSRPGKLSDYEFRLIQEHCRAGFSILEGIQFPWPVASAVMQHHERVNGSGYPSHLKDGEIIVEAKILAVADVIESMASHRPYRPALGLKIALEEICEKSGVLYDSDVVDATMKLFQEGRFTFDS
ncbi:MAG TPA: HD domain-containing phosphohydrolase [Syntrophorhabdaceae bacterium]|nr:HD domain-containing phosphohydrolase [Syntrophorhabdaceae bacterium]